MHVSHIQDQYIDKAFSVETQGNVLLFAVPATKIQDVCLSLYQTHKLQMKTIFATDERATSVGFKIVYVFGIPGENVFLMPYIVLKETTSFPSIAREIHEASGYERKIHSFFGLNPVGHPEPRGMLLHENWPANMFPLRKDFDAHKRPPLAKGEYAFQKVEGEGVYEIPVGPVHAGIIEPGHFRFSVAGEEILLLEAKLGFTHKGTEKLFETLPLEEKVRLSERVSGDTSFTHALAFCQAVETLAGINVPERAQYLRVLYSELERLANHLIDVGFIMSDTGYNFGGATGTRLREQVMQWHERLTGSRFLRGVNVIGGVTKDVDEETAKALLLDLQKIYADFSEFIEISEESSTLLNRLEGTGTVDRQIASDHGIVGVPSRAIGIAHDARKEYPYAIYDTLSFDIALEQDGDVCARMYIRIKEIASSMGIIEQVLAKLPKGEICFQGSINLQKNSIAVGVTESWRGDVTYTVMTDAHGDITRVDVRDPSFLNWPIVGHTGKGNVVPDFPLINKSFNLSYSGNDV